MACTSNVEYLAIQHYKQGLKQCDFCNKQFTQSASLKRHISSFHENTLVNCTICEKKLFKSSLEYHIRHVHNDEENEKASKCTLCEKTFCSQFALKEHIRLVHNIERNMECIKCDKKFGQRGTLNYHIRSVHGKEKKTKDSWLKVLIIFLWN